MSRKHYLAVLGTGNYNEVYYTINGEIPSQPDRYVQAAVLRFRKEELKDGDMVTIFVTKEAKRKHWEPAEGKGLRETLIELFDGTGIRIQSVDIPDGNHSNEELLELFRIMYDSIEKDEEIIFDITHGLRSLPLLALAIINYARMLKNCTVDAIYYGVFEARETKKIEKNGSQQEITCAPIIDLADIDALLRWANASHAFAQYGLIGPMEELYKASFDQQDRVSYGKEMDRFKNLRATVESMKTLSDAIETSRGTDIEKVIQRKMNKGDAKKSIKAAYQEVRRNLDKSEVQSLLEQKPYMSPLFTQIQDAISVFDTEDIFHIGMETTRWCISRGKIQQGYTALEESMFTYFCGIAGFNETKREEREIVSRILSTGNKLSQENHAFQSAGELLLIWEEKVLEYVRKESDEETESDSKRGKVRQLIHYCANHPETGQTEKNLKEIFTLVGRITDDRNDINHFGFRRDPLSPQDLMKRLKENYNELKKLTGYEEK